MREKEIHPVEEPVRLCQTVMVEAEAQSKVGHTASEAAAPLQYAGKLIRS